MLINRFLSSLNSNILGYKRRKKGPYEVSKTKRSDVSDLSISYWLVVSSLSICQWSDDSAALKWSYSSEIERPMCQTNDSEK